MHGRHGAQLVKQLVRTDELPAAERLVGRGNEHTLQRFGTPQCKPPGRTGHLRGRRYLRPGNDRKLRRGADRQKSYHPGIRLFGLVPRRALAASSGLAPVAVAAGWIPLRADLPNADVALLLALCVGAAALVGGRAASVLGAVAAATAFDFFDTPPYGQLFMNRGRDAITTAVLAGAGLLVGELCVRVRAYRVMATSRKADFAVMSGAARLMALGEEASMVVGALAGELVSRVGLADCEFEYGPPLGDRPCVARDGSLVYLGGPLPKPSVPELDLPVWAGTDVVGRYRLCLVSGAPPSSDRLLAAVGIAEQAGAALAADRPSLPSPPVRRRRLHLLR